jgi:uncharacterized membrane protein/2-hydroxychromene-2-carboxylate isomerase
MRSIALCGLAFCGASVADTFLGRGAYCDVDSGCGEVISSEFADPLGIPLALVGLTGFALVFVLSLFPGHRARFALFALSIAGGLVGAALVLIQFLVLKRICWLCMLADICGIVLMIVGIVGWRDTNQNQSYSWNRRVVWLTIGVVAATAPIVWSTLRPGPGQAPAEVRALWVEGRVTVVEVTDFDCPHCATADHILKDVLREEHTVHFVRVPAPMPIHANARPAARAYLAAQRQGKAEEMAAALYAAESRSTDECRKLASSIGLNLDDYDRVVVDSATDAELDATVAWARRTGYGLPQIWVHDRLIPYVPTPEKLRQAIRQAVPFTRTK